MTNEYIDYRINEAEQVVKMLDTIGPVTDRRGQQLTFLIPAYIIGQLIDVVKELKTRNEM